MIPVRLLPLDTAPVEVEDRIRISPVQVQPATAVAFGFDNDLHSGSDSGAADAVRVEGKDLGVYADQIQAEVRAATSGEADAFDLAVIEDGVYRVRLPVKNPPRTTLGFDEGSGRFK